MTAETAQPEREKERDVSTFALDVYWAAGRVGDAAVDEHVAGCARCRAYLASLDALEASGPSFRRPTAAARAPARRRWVLPVAGAVAMAAAAAVVARGQLSETDKYVGIKGTPAVQLLVHRDRDTRLWDGRSPLHPGDALALRVACEGLKRVAVASPGQAGWVRLSSVACPVHDEPLPFTLQVDNEPGDEKLAVVLSQEDLDDESLRKAIAESRRAPDVWVVSFVMPKETETDR